MSAGQVIDLQAIHDWIFIWQLDHTPVIEAGELSRVLGYVQRSSLRKQVLTDWKADFIPETDFSMCHSESQIRQYDKALRATGIVGGPPVSPERGYLFLLYPGFQKILKRTKKPRCVVLLHHTKINAVFAKNPPGAPQVKPSQQETPEDRKYKYEVFQTLLQQLQTLDDPTLREIAIVAVEEATGRDLTSLRTKFLTPAPVESKPLRLIQDPPESTSELYVLPKPQTSVTRMESAEGPLFEKEEFYSLARIGELAGGYSAGTAGKAANLVAERMGYTPAQIRQSQLSFNELPVLKDSNGKMRQMFRFGRNFSNEVVLELRRNPKFQPMTTVGPLPFDGPNRPARLTDPLNIWDDPALGGDCD